MNNETNRTPGPWHVVGEIDDMYNNIQVLAEDNAFIVRVNSANHRNVANARLIAAAPELLAACNAVDSLLTQYMVIGKNQHVLEPMLEMVRNAIFKAESK